MHKPLAHEREKEALVVKHRDLAWSMCAMYDRLLNLCYAHGWPLFHRLHAHILRQESPRLASMLLHMYAQCGHCEAARSIFDAIPPHSRPPFAWNVMIAAYSRSPVPAEREEALLLYDRMPLHGLRPDKFAILPALSSVALLSDVKRIHVHVAALERTLALDAAVATALLCAYAKQRRTEDAGRLFKHMPERDAVAWNAMISAYAQNGHFLEAVALLAPMISAGMNPSKGIFLCLLDACANPPSLDFTHAMHERIVSSQFESDIIVKTALLDAYGKCGSTHDARIVFDGMEARDGITWNAMIMAYTRNGHGKEALSLFKLMYSKGFRPTAITFLGLLNACASLASLEDGKMIHKCVDLNGLQSDKSVQNALLDMYGKCGSLADARSVFDAMPERDVVSWSSMIAACTLNRHHKEALTMFRQMSSEGVEPDKVTFLILLSACAGMASLEDGKSIHQRLCLSGVETDLALSTALVNMYGKCGCLEEARVAFNGIARRDLVSWNAMLAVYAQSGYGDEVLELFKHMESEGVKPDIVTVICLLGACASLASLETGRAIHELIASNDEFETVAMKNALVSMYGKCGSPEEARLVFDAMKHRDVVSWASMITAYAQNGRGEEALELFWHMQREGGARTDLIIALCLLHACSHGHLWEEGVQFFQSMKSVYDLTPLEEHYACVVDLLGRAGRLQEAEDVVRNMPIQTDDVVWTAFVGACQSHGSSDQREVLDMELCLDLDMKNAAPYIVLSRTYHGVDNWDG